MALMSKIPFLDRQKGNIKDISSKIEHEYVAFTNDFFVETIGDSSGK